MRQVISPRNSAPLFFFAALFAVFFAIFFSSPKVGAAALPNQTDFTSVKGSGQPGVKLVVSDISSGNSLRAPESVIRIYSTKKDNIKINIAGWRHCPGNHDTNHVAITTFEVWRTDQDESQTYRAIPDFDNSGVCGDNGTKTITVNAGQKSRLKGHEPYYVLILRATIPSGVNSFNVSSPGNPVGYSDTASERFALQDRTRPSDTTMNARLYFGSPCSWRSDQPMAVRWSDDDYNHSPQGNPGGGSQYHLDASLEERPPGGNWRNVPGGASLRNKSSNGTGFVGQGGGGKFEFTMKPNYKYRWTWKKVKKTNGIQFKLPVDSFWYQTRCKDEGWRLSSTTSVDLTEVQYVVSGSASAAKKREEAIKAFRLANFTHRLKNEPPRGGRDHVSTPRNNSSQTGCENGNAIKTYCARIQWQVYDKSEGKSSNWRWKNPDNSPITRNAFSENIGKNETKPVQRSSGQGDWWQKAPRDEYIRDSAGNYRPLNTLLGNPQQGDKYCERLATQRRASYNGNRFYSKPKCVKLAPKDTTIPEEQYELFPRITASPETVTQGGTINITPSVENKGPDASSGTQRKVTQFMFMDIKDESEGGDTDGGDDTGGGTLEEQINTLGDFTSESASQEPCDALENRIPELAEENRNPLVNLFASATKPERKWCYDQYYDSVTNPDASNTRSFAKGITSNFTASGIEKFNTFGNNHRVQYVDKRLFIGVNICYILSVKPYETGENSWRHSSPDCVRIAKKPSIQFQNQDVRAGKVFSKEACDLDAVAERADIVTSVNQVGSNKYRSASDYSAFATGEIKQFSSAGGQTGNNQNKVLSFGNYLSTGNFSFATKCIGSEYYQEAQAGTLIDKGSSINVNSLENGKKYEASGEDERVKVSGTMEKGVRASIYVDGDVEINGDLKYPDGTYSKGNLRDLPRLTIVASGDVIISGNVNRVDAWIVSERLLTCSSSLVNQGRLTSRVCRKVLNMNGPVAVDKAVLARTAGAECFYLDPGEMDPFTYILSLGAYLGTYTGGSSDTEIDCGDYSKAAEIFNLRPDQLLNTYAPDSDPDSDSGTDWQTIRLTDLPPRY